MLDANNEPCIFLIKSGCSTGVTIGHATEYPENGPHQTSMAWSIIPYDKSASVFSAPGDSGAIIFDGQGHIDGVLTGGTGQTETTDVTHATPFYWLTQRIKEHFPHANLNQVTAEAMRRASLQESIHPAADHERAFLLSFQAPLHTPAGHNLK